MTLTNSRRLSALALVGGLLAVLFVAPTASAADSQIAPSSITGGIKITKVVYNPSGDERYTPNREKVYIKNVSARSKNLRGVVLSDPAGHRYRLPSYTLGSGRTVIVHSGSGTNGSGHLYARWNTAVWNNTGDTARLKSSGGILIDRCRWSGGGVSVTC
ncbi:lamin tail domain-containing protein [Myceligenerans pegani]|uniref:Lamin tail domain-containing protein n=1 Tax=Myceligenerans pegani TaxID=2776917 RepID=A0ABR9MVR5_9MICO|nr:lamin tail domain-containing protein [Myceligenerans sp. TRM 65318]MBE1875479.1 lamin tail domain-containing protein [Myceligenerans sp. TRM 65318]MBE3017750.1 lamin tail domain-containing protein [Myceligenerans sp. TRM 65318]